MTSIQDIAVSWAKRVTDTSVRQRTSRSSNVFAEGDEIYSYGHHFEIGRVIRESNGKPRLVLLNGDRYSNSTTGHQSTVRSALKKHCPDVPMVIIPYTALRASLIDMNTIMPIDVRPDGAEYTLHVEDEPPKGAGMVDGRHCYRRDVWIGQAEPGEIVDRWDVEEKRMVTVKPSPDVAMRGVQVLAYAGQIVECREDGRYQWWTMRHWLGDSLFAARLHGQKRRTKWLSSFDRNEPSRLYFLCALPPTPASTIEEALEALKPESVKVAEAMGRDINRQGDMFAIHMPGLTLRDLKKRGAVVAKRSAGYRSEEREQWHGGTLTVKVPVREVARQVSLMGTSHTATEVATMPDGTQYIRGMMYHDPAMMGEDRQRDHVRRALGNGKDWYMVQRNTVPVR